MINIIQLQLLNYILDSQDYSIISLNNIDESYFPAYKNEFNFIKTHFNTYGNVPDKTSFLNTFPNFDIVKVNESKNYLLDEIYKERKTQYLTSAFNEMRELIISNKTEDAEALLNKISEETPQFAHFNTIDLISNDDRFNSYLDKCDDYKKFYAKTGFSELDNILGGWDRNEELATIVGRPGIGKSYILFKCALAAAEQGLNVGLYEGEMAPDQVGYRLDTLISHISNGQLTHGNKNIKDAYKAHLEKIKSKIKGTFKILTPNMLGGLATVSDLRAFIERDKIDILFVDQYSLMADERKAKSAYERTTNITVDLKNLQVMKRIPIIAASQQNREKEESGVDLRQIAQADAIGQYSTTVLFLEQKDGILTIHLVKARYSGGCKSLKYKVDYDKGVYTYIPEDDEEESSNSDLDSLKLSYEQPLDTEDPF